jgi:hypothetical protein
MKKLLLPLHVMLLLPLAASAQEAAPHAWVREITLTIPRAYQIPRMSTDSEDPYANHTLYIQDGVVRLGSEMDEMSVSERMEFVERNYCVIGISTASLDPSLAQGGGGPRHFIHGDEPLGDVIEAAVISFGVAGKYLPRQGAIETITCFAGRHGTPFRSLADIQRVLVGSPISIAPATPAQTPAAEAPAAE